MGTKHRAVPFEGMLLRETEQGALLKARRSRHVHPDLVARIVERLGACRAYVASEVDWQGAYEEACDAIERLVLDHRTTIERDREGRDRLRREHKRELEAAHAETVRVREERDDALQQARDGFARGMRLGREKGREEAGVT